MKTETAEDAKDQRHGDAADTKSDAPASLKDLVTQYSGGYRSVHAMAYEILRDAILSGTLAPGERLRQETLADLIGVSRLPVRSALIRLQSEGLVQFHDRKGAVVKTLTREQAEEIYKLRIVLEGYALRRTMAIMDDDLLNGLRRLADNADTQGEGPEFVKARTEFYRALYDAENQPMLSQLIDDLKTRVGSYLLGWRLSSESHQSHKDLVESIAAGDVDAAVESLAHHLRMVRDGVIALLEPGADPRK